MTGIDLNRAGTPLLEIVSEPDLRGAQEAVAYARALHALVRWIGICDGNMQEGSFRCDANVSVRTAGDGKLGTRCEIKNLNSFRFMEQAIEFEARRQIEILEGGGKIEQETRLYDPERNETRSMRTKEDAQDYRYFPDPDLLPLVVSEQDDRARSSAACPSCPTRSAQRYVEKGVSGPRRPACSSRAAIAPSSSSEAVASGAADDAVARTGRSASSSAAAEREGTRRSRKPGVAGATLAALLKRVADGTISRQDREGSAVEACGPAKAAPIDRLIDKRGLKQISDAGAIEKLVDEVLAKNAKQVEDYRAGKEKAFNSLVGQVMKATQGKANPAQVNEILRKKLGR